MILRGAAVKGRIAEIRHDEEAWLDERMAAHRQPENDFRLTLRTGHSYALFERRVATGGTALVLMDVTVECPHRVVQFDC